MHTNKPSPEWVTLPTSKPATHATRRRPGKAAMLACAVGAACLAFAAGATQAAPGNTTEDWAKGRVLVMPRAGLSDSQLSKILSAHGGKAKKIGHTRIYIVELPAGVSEKAVAAQLNHHPHLKFAELDHRVSPDFVANDPYLGSEWHLAKIGTASAWDSSQGAGITVAILDSGVDAAHPDLAGQLVPGWNFYENNSNTADVYGHGTKVAGAAAAAIHNAVGVAGVAGGAKIMPIRVSGSDGYATWSGLTSGIAYAADHGARVANASFLGVSSSASVQNAAQYMKSKGGLVTVSGGNTGVLESYTKTTSMIPVAATDGNDVRTSWSSYGDYIALAAPGAGIWTTTNGGGYGAVSGTSFSSPVTAGVIALMMAANPTLPSTQVESLLFATAVDLGPAGRDAYYGYGRVDAAAAVSAALAATSTADTQAPSVSVTSPAGGSSVSGWVPVDVAASDNVGVSRVELRVNGTTVGSDTSAPFAFSWDSTTVPNGMANIVAYAFDAAGNSKASTAVAVNVANAVVADTTPPVVRIVSPAAGSTLGTKATVSVSASDDRGNAGIKQTLYIDGALKATATGATLSYSWNTRKLAGGAHTVTAVATDAAGNTSSVSVQVSK